MAPTEGRVAKPKRQWDCRRGTLSIITATKHYWQSSFIGDKIIYAHMNPLTVTAMWLVGIIYARGCYKVCISATTFSADNFRKSWMSHRLLLIVSSWQHNRQAQMPGRQLKLRLNQCFTTLYLQSDFVPEGNGDGNGESSSQTPLQEHAANNLVNMLYNSVRVVDFGC